MMRAPRLAAASMAAPTEPGDPSRSRDSIATGAPAAACAAKKPARTASAARANGVAGPGRISTISGSVSAGAFAVGCAAADNVTNTSPGSATSRAHVRNSDAVPATARRPDENARAVSHSPLDDDPLVAASGVAMQDLPAGALYVVATPIGNAADVTLRALWVLSKVDAIAAEDTRNAGAFLRRYGIATPLLAAHKHNERAAADAILARLRAGGRVALVTDAGTPAISDPGARVVRVALDAGIRVVPIPGASSLTAAASAAGLSGAALTFIGFLPTGRRERERLLRELVARGEAFVLFEAPHRVAATAAELAAMLDAHRRIVVARELTKKFESLQVCRVETLAAAIGSPRGEYVLLVDAAAAAGDIDAVTRRWLAALAEVLPASRAAAVAAKASGAPRDRLYALITSG
jgi:16S rRNA (cytidine1402-2'-O)-methyltransferase